MLAEVALALGVLDDHARVHHRVADAAQQRLDARGAQHRVVDVVAVGRRQPAIGAVPRLLVAVVEDHELELGAGVGLPAALGQARELARAGPGAARRRPASRPPIRRRPGTARCPRATSCGTACRGRASSRSRRSRAPSSTSRSRRRCSCRRRRRAGSCSPRRRGRPPIAGTTARVRRLPCRRPCMSVRASRTVSMSPAAISAFSSSRVMAARPYLAARTSVRELWSRRHTNARARRHHRPPGARARPAGGRAAAARGRHHQPQLPRCAWAARTSSLRLCDRGAEVLGIDRSDRGDRLAPRRGRAASPRRSSPSSSDVPALVTRWLPGGDVAAEQRAHAGRHGAGRRDAAPAARHAGAADGVRDRSALVEDAARARRRRLPDSYERLLGLLAPHRGGADRPRARPGLLPQRPADRQLRARRRARVHRRLGVRGDERPLLRPRQPVGQQRLRGRATTARCSSCTSTSRSTERALRRAAAHARRSRDFREAMWGVVQHAALRRSTSTTPATRAEHFDRLERAAADPRVEEWLAVAATA